MARRKSIRTVINIYDYCSALLNVEDWSGWDFSNKGRLHLIETKAMFINMREKLNVIAREEGYIGKSDTLDDYEDTCDTISEQDADSEE